MFGYLKEKFRLSVYKAIIVKKTGTSVMTHRVSYGFNEQTGQPEKKEIELDTPVTLSRWRIMKVKYVNPNNEYFKHRVGSLFSREKVTKNLPIDFSFEAYNHNERHVMFIDWDTGGVAQLGGGEIVYTLPPEQEAVKSSLIRSCGDLMRGKMDTAMILLALGLGVFLGIFIQNTLIPMLGGMA